LVVIIVVVVVVVVFVVVVVVVVVVVFLNFTVFRGSLTFPPLKRYTIHCSTIGYTDTYLKLCNGIFLLLCQMCYSGEIAATTTFTA
jgi:hypothetical protein